MFTHILLVLLNPTSTTQMPARQIFSILKNNWSQDMEWTAKSHSE